MKIHGATARRGKLTVGGNLQSPETSLPNFQGRGLPYLSALMEIWQLKETGFEAGFRWVPLGGVVSVVIISLNGGASHMEVSGAFVPPPATNAVRALALELDIV